MKSEDKIIEKYLDLLDEESQLAESWWWLSFADPHKPKGTQFLGAVIVKARGEASATQKVNWLGLNPGGEIMFVKIPDGKVPKEEDTHRLLMREEAESIDFDTVD